MALDPDDPRPPYQQVANHLRAAILTKKFAPGEKLPSGPELSKRYGVARMTVQQALRLLREEGLIVSRQGSGVFVRSRPERPVGLRPHIERAFESDHVTVDFAGASGEPLAAVLAEPLAKIRAGRLTPESVHVCVLVPDTAVPWTLPCRVEDFGDDPGFRARAAEATHRSLGAVTGAITELGALGLVKTAIAEVRVHSVPPLFELYVLNDQEAFFGFHPITEHAVTIDGVEREVYDVMGKDVTLFHHSMDSAEDASRLFVAQSRLWFDSVWDTIAREYAP